MLDFNQPLKQLRKIAFHHLRKFPNLFVARAIANSSMLRDLEDNEFIHKHPIAFFINFPLGNWRYYASFNGLDEWQSFIPVFRNTGEVMEKAAHVRWTDVSDAIRYKDASISITPVSVLGPKNIGAYRSFRLRTPERRTMWMAYELTKLLLPHRRLLAENIPILAHHGPNYAPDTHRITWDVLAAAATQAMDYVAVGMLGVWEGRTGFYDWYEQRRRIPKRYFQLLHRGAIGTLDEPETYCPHCRGWIRDCRHGQGAAMEAPLPPPQERRIRMQDIVEGPVLRIPVGQARQMTATEAAMRRREERLLRLVDQEPLWRIAPPPDVVPDAEVGPEPGELVDAGDFAVQAVEDDIADYGDIDE